MAKNSPKIIFLFYFLPTQKNNQAGKIIYSEQRVDILKFLFHQLSFSTSDFKNWFKKEIKNQNKNQQKEK
jgi:hypothetical protein